MGIVRIKMPQLAKSIDARLKKQKHITIFQKSQLHSQVEMSRDSQLKFGAE